MKKGHKFKEGKWIPIFRAKERLDICHVCGCMRSTTVHDSGGRYTYFIHGENAMDEMPECGDPITRTEFMYQNRKK